MKIRLISDIHLEFYRYDMMIRFCDYLFPEKEIDRETILVLAGDIFTPNTMGVNVFRELIELLSKQYRHIIYIPGNHEFYHGGIIHETINRLKEVDGIVENYTRLEYFNEPLIIDDVIFMGDTMWTYVDPITQTYEKQISDYNIIHLDDEDFDYRPLDSAYTNSLHELQMMGLNIKLVNMKEQFPEYKYVLVSHHGPTPVSFHPHYKGNQIEGFFFNKKVDQKQIDFYKQFDLILHGHTHWSHDTVDSYTDVRTISNCYGYPNENCNFDNEKLIELLERNNE